MVTLRKGGGRDIRMRSHGLQQLVDDKSVASCQ